MKPTRLLAAGLFAALAWTAACRRPDATPSRAADEGTSAAADDAVDQTASVAAAELVALETVDKAAFDERLAGHRGQVVLVDFWATWCGPCKEGFPHTAALARKYGPRGLRVLSVSFDDPDDPAAVDAARRFLSDYAEGIEHLISRHGSGEQSFEDFEIAGGALPNLQLFDRQGRRVQTFASGDPDAVYTADDVAQAVAELVESEQPARAR